MNSFGEIRTCLVLMFSALLIIKTRARFIYHPDTALNCLQAKVPCSGHHSEDSCKEYCVGAGFMDGLCSDSCCLCYAAPGLPTPHRPVFSPFSTSPKISKVVEIPSTEIETPKKEQFEASKDSTGIDFDLETQESKSSIYEMDNNEIKSSICLTPNCVKAANNILVNMDETLDPCIDFYQFACGNFEKQTVIPDHKGQVTVLGSLNDKVHQQIRTMLEEPSNQQDKTENKRSTQLVKNLYQSCLNQEALESLGVKPLKSVLKSLGGWPVVEGNKWDSKTWTWTDSVHNLKDVGISAGYFLTLSVIPDIKNPGQRIIMIGEPKLSFGREQLPNPVFMNAYNKYQIDLAVLLGAETSSAIKEMKSVLHFERALANISLPREHQRAHPLTFYNPMTIEELQSRFPPVNWLDFISKSLPESLEITSKEVVIVAVPPHLNHLLRLLEMTDKRTLANYAMWRAASSMLSYLSEEGRRIQFEFSSKVTGQREKPTKWSECVGLVTTTLAHAVGSMYVQKYFNEGARSKAIEMFQEIHHAFASVLSEATWMDEVTQRKAYEKAKAMRSHIAYPKELLDENKLLALYDGLELNPNNFFGNVLNITKSATNFSLKKLRKPIDPNDWKSHGKPAVVNAFYSPLENSIQFPAGILQGHFFDSDRPHFLNFGAIGWVAGHEIIHGFDDQGKNFDLNGNLNDWWDPTTKKTYFEKTQCIVEQYSQFKYTDLVTNTSTPLNGVISLGENIADGAGIKLAFRGYQAWAQRNGQEKMLPGLSYSPNQMFWISAANNWCSKHRPEAMHNMLKTGVHPPGKFRVNGSFKNSKQFAQDFQCPVGSQMNPAKKCSVW